MNFTLTTKETDDYLFITSVGSILSKEELFKHSELVYIEAMKSNKKKVLVDDTETRFPPNLFSYADLVNYYDDEFSVEVKDFKVAIVMSTEFVEVGKFWETYCNNRGFKFFSFTDIQEAKDWLNED